MCIFLAKSVLSSSGIPDRRNARPDLELSIVLLLNVDILYLINPPERERHSTVYCFFFLFQWNIYFCIFTNYLANPTLKLTRRCQCSVSNTLGKWSAVNTSLLTYMGQVSSNSKWNKLSKHQKPIAQNIKQWQSWQFYNATN